MNITLNTHDYDRYIGDIYHNLKEIDNKNLLKPSKFKDTLDDIELQIETLKPLETYILCKNVLILLRYDISNNYDSLNNISVEDILPRTWRFVKNYDNSGKNIFYEQLADIWNGPCPQGRVSRIFQFYINHINKSDPLFLSLKIS